MLSKKIKKQILNWVSEAKSRFLLDSWDVVVMFKSHHKNAVMEVAPDQEYLRASVWVYENKAQEELKNFGSEALKKCCYHEMAHILTNELYSVGKRRHSTPKDFNDAWEHLAELITRIVLK